MADWLNTTRTSYWQRGCDDAKAGKPRQMHRPASVRGWSPETESYDNGYDFGARMRMGEQTHELRAHGVEVALHQSKSRQTPMDSGEGGK